MPGKRADSAFILSEEVRKVIEDSEITLSIGETTRRVHFKISGGVASYPADSSEPAELVRKADEALYRAKQTGRNRICLPASGQMVTKTSHYTQTQLERLSAAARRLDRSEAFLLREALDDLLRKYTEEPRPNA
jgi:predicted signal transduction protein with EAL and GGDEF domain